MTNLEMKASSMEAELIGLRADIRSGMGIIRDQITALTQLVDPLHRLDFCPDLSLRILRLSFCNRFLPARPPHRWILLWSILFPSFFL